jgi:release factor glutamine methyltransferase
MTIREAVTLGSSSLKAAGVGTSNLDASLLLAHVLEISRTTLAVKGTERLSEQTLGVFSGLIDRRLNGECVAYILGKKEFFTMEFMVNKNVLVPRPETETLVETALRILEKMNNGNIASGIGTLRVLDICTGAGIIAISLKHEKPALQVYACDISKEALAVAEMNAKRILSESCRIDFYNGNLFKAVPKSSLQFSLIVSNPPYIPSNKIKTLSIEVQNEPRLALDGGKSGLKFFKQIIKNSRSYLEKGGSLLLEADPSQMKKITVMLEKGGFSNIKLYNDLSGQQRVISGVYEKKNKK